MSKPSRQQIPIAVVGVSTLFPGSTDSRGFWDDILAGKDLITDVPPTHWLIEDYYDPDPKALDKTYAKRGGFMPTVDFDPMEFGIPPSIVPATDSAQILALIVAQKVLDDAAQGQFANMDRERISVLLGVTSAQELLGNMVSRLQKPVWLKALRESGVPETEAQDICLRIANSYTPWQESSFPGLLGNVVAGRIANRFDLRGTNTVTDAACASSLAAVSMGINELQVGQSDLVITGGVDAMNDIFMYLCFSKTPALSPTGDCRPFSDAADGTMLGEGIAMMALKRLDDAERDGDRVYAVIRGVGSASDGRANSVYAPLPAGQARSLTRTYDVAGYGPETVELVEAHGTGTKAGDAAEFAGLKLAFGGAREDNQWCALGTVKSQIGHAKASAGAAGLFKAIMALHHKVLPPTIKVDRPNPKLEIEQSPFYLNTQRRPWIRDASHPRRASVSSFGFGGSNFHVTLEEYVPSVPTGKSAWRLRTVPTELVLLSAASPAELVAQCRALAGVKKELCHTARETQLAFSVTAGARLAVIAANADELAQKLTQAAATIEKAPNAAYSSPTGVHYATGAADTGKLAFLFPGQGSQYVGMGAEVAMAFDVARQAWDDAANLPFDGVPLHNVVFPKPVFSDADREAQQKQLTATEWAQPALGVHSQSLANVLHLVGVMPSCVAGHSFGEVSALHEAGVLDAASLVKVARRRGELMRDASAVPGAMTAVAKAIDEVRAAVSESGANVVVANHNSPTQVVLSGSVEEITKVEAALGAKGMTAKRLPVATAFHSPLVAGSSVPFGEFLQGVAFNAPLLDVYSNATAASYATEPAAIRTQLAAQLAQSVRFVEQIEAMYASGVRTFVEVGAGSVLTELVGRILGERPHRAISLDRKGKHGVTTLQEGLGRLALAGVAMDFAPLWAQFAPASDKPVKKPAMTMPICGANTGSPYPPPGGAKALPPPNPPRALPVAPEPIIIRETVVVHEPTPASVPVSMPVSAPAFAAVSVPASSSAAAPVLAAAPVAAQPAVVPPVAVAQAPAVLVAPALNRVPDAHLAWVHAFQETQRQTADAHAAYQRAMADSHMAFLRTAESSYAGLGAMLGNAAPVQQTWQPTPAAAAPLAPAVFAPGATVASVAPAVPALVASTPAPIAVQAVVAAQPVPVSVAPVVAVVNAPAPVVAKSAPAAVAAPVAAAAPAIDMEALMMAIVAEKTGYPQEMLGIEMELEADLGIDSIKRVEILSAMRERAPNLPEVKPTELATLRTLGQIIDHMRAAGGAALAAAPVATSAAVSAASTAPAIDLEALMMAIVAEKTGYPQEMLGVQMELEADLGIDSIKRVEILSAMRERAPNLPEVKPTELANLRTLGQIIDHMRAAGGAALAAVPVAANAAVPVAAAPAAPTIDLEALMMAIVAEKTGYPQEMLGVQMELEADLGIDSIKRVEILSAMRERAPNLPEVKPTELAALRTLGQIIDHMRAAGGAALAAAPVTAIGTPASVAANASTESAGAGIDLEALMMSIVAEKTGYPQEMLGVQMELEADLGIDSIKRVEILSAMRERAPNLPEVKPTELATLRTLGQIIDHMRAAGGAALAAVPVAATTAASVAAAAAPAAPAIDLEALMMSIVAEKTGYPQEMLGVQMELEADLGIDSIKRVEILSSMRERAPNLPEVKPTELATLRTLGQIIDHMRAAGSPAPAAVAASASPAPDVQADIAQSVSRFAVREVAASAVGMALAGVLGAQRLVVTDEGTGVAQALVAGLAAHGVAASVVASVPADADGVVFLGGLRAVATVDEAVAVNREAFQASRTVAARLTAQGGAFVTVQDTGGDFGLSGRDTTRAFLGGVSALARTAALEWPAASVKAIDLERGTRSASELAQAILTELLQGGSTLEVGLHADGRRSTLASVATPSPTLAADNINKNAVLVASGGGRGVTAACLIALAQAKQPRVVLLGRTALADEPDALRAIADDAGLKRALLQRAQAQGIKPTPADINAQLSNVLALREIRATLAALQAAGSEARYLAVDVADAGALNAALDSVRKDWGSLTALVHGAGVLADKRIEEKTDAQFDRVFDTKVSGLRALLAATANDPLTAVCLFSSVAARSGNLGQCDYAMANEVLNLVACAEQARRGAGCVVRAIGWGPWDGGMVTPSLKSHFEHMGVALIPLAAGAQRFVDELTCRSDATQIVIGGAQGDGALGASVTPQATVEVRVSQASHPYLADHAIAGVPVVPMVLAVEWFMRAAQACRPDLVASAVKQVKVLRGIKLAQFAGAGDCFAVRARQVADGGTGAEIAVEFRGKNDVLHYSATVAMTAQPVAAPALAAAPTLQAWTQAAVYDGHVLFHGPSFQVINAVQGVSREGIVGTLAGTSQVGWPLDAWCSDVASLDGGLQLALLWSRQVLGGAVLPMALGEYRSYRSGLAAGPVTGVVHGRQIHGARTVCDMAFVDGNGQVVAELMGVETVLRPDAAPATPATPAQAA